MNLKHQTIDSQHSIPSDGVILVNKDSGIRTTALLNRVKKILHLKKAGHAGTLDPFAEGLIVVLYGKATKVMEYIGDFKEYICTVRLGIITDTDDPDGNIIKQTTVPDFPKEKLEEVLTKFKGKIKQKVPLYSAIKKDGERLYKKAREGIEIKDLPIRDVYIKKLKLLDFSPPFFVMRCIANRGTYMRALARDIGNSLGYGAHLSKLTRVKVDPYDITDALKLSDIEEGKLRVIKLRDALPHLSAITLDEEGVWNFVHGGKVRGFYPEGLYQVKNHLGNLIGIGRGETYAIQPVKVLYST